tara:strand:- start:7577 stop:8566 length:990 start_codon:yes stop_codon:yes gene_type:complete
MAKYITSYFYNDAEDAGASYGNIFLPLEQRNLVYWRTVYTLFFTSIVKNKNENIKYAFFTNVSCFPLRSEIESLGVAIFDDLQLSHRNDKEWATVKFFFDVINYIEDSLYFNDGDSVIMLDTDCIGLNSAAELFSHVASADRPIAYRTGNVDSSRFLFHGLSIPQIEKAFEGVFASKITIKDTIGGEFFGFNKNDNLRKLREQYDQLLTSEYCDLLTTEEQILTMLNANAKFVNIEFSIYRIWTAYRNYDVSSDLKRFTFLHLPSEKVDGLNRIFKQLVKMTPSTLTSDSLNKIIFSHMPLHNPIKLYVVKIINDLKKKIISLTRKILI